MYYRVLSSSEVRHDQRNRGNRRAQRKIELLLTIDTAGTSESTGQCAIVRRNFPRKWIFSFGYLAFVKLVYLQNRNHDARVKNDAKHAKKKRKWTYLAEMKTLIRKLFVNLTVPAKNPALTAKTGK